MDGGKKRKIKWILLAGILLLLIAGGIILKNSTIKTVTVTGNGFYTKDQIKTMILGNTKNKNTVTCFLENQFGEHESYPFIERYQIEIINPHEIEIIVYEKSIIGYVAYMGSYMYFDRDGTVVESSMDKLDGICEVTGLSFSQIVLNEQIQASQSDIFSQIHLMTQLFEKYKLDIKQINFDSSGQVSISVEEINVQLGTTERMDLKIAALNDILPVLEDQKGTLYLDDVQASQASSGSYYFKKAAETGKEEETEQAE